MPVTSSSRKAGTCGVTVPIVSVVEAVMASFFPLSGWQNWYRAACCITGRDPGSAVRYISGWLGQERRCGLVAEQKLRPDALALLADGGLASPRAACQAVDDGQAAAGLG